MKKLYKPYFILLTIIFPQILMIGIFGRIFWFLHTELTEGQIAYWAKFGTVVVMLCVGLTIYAVVRWVQRKDVPIYMAYLIFGFYLCFLIAYFFLYGEMIPGSIPSYLLMGVSPAITILTLTMPALIYGMLLIVEHSVERFQIKSILKPFLFMIAIPIFWYIFMNIINIIDIENWGSRGGADLFRSMLLIIFTVSGVAFLFLFVMITYMVLKRKQHLWQRYIGVIVFVGSLMGLVVNHSFGNAFGNFSHWGFYLCNIAVTGVLLLPQTVSHKLRMLIFGIKGCLIGYSVYFFIVFLPYMPLALPGIIVFGLGVLLLMPTLLLFLHVQSLVVDFTYFRQFYKKQHLIAFFSIQLLVVPVIMGAIVHQDQVNLSEALRYTYQRSYQEETKVDISTSGIQRALNTIKRIGPNNRNGNFLFTMRTSTPYLTSLYYYYVLDNLSIAQDKVKRLENIFLGEHAAEETALPVDTQRGIDVHVNQVESNTVFDAKEQVYRSWIHLKLENAEDGLSEFYTVFSLPEGSYISDYYLYVEGEKKQGMIADKRAANWIYEQSRIINRDPGVLTYLTGSEIEFKIFPFLAKEVRETGIEIVHRTPIDFMIRETQISLRETEPSTHIVQQAYPRIHPQIAYITQEIKAELPKITRKPKYYFILDYSKGNQKNKELYMQRVESFIKAQKIERDVSEIIGANFEENSVIYQEGWQKHLQGMAVKGGFNPEYTMKRILYKHYSNQLEEQPVFILVTDTIEKTAPLQNFTDLSFMSPEGLRCYQLTEETELVEYALQMPLSQDRGKRVAELTHIPVLVWQHLNGRTFYLPDDGEDSIVLTEEEFTVAEDELSVSTWENGVLLKGMYRSYLLRPEQYFEKSLAIVKGSIVSHVMSPLTSFIVLENEAQEKVMLEKQKQILESQKPLDIEDMREMNEPSLLIMTFIVIGFLVSRKRKKQGSY